MKSLVVGPEDEFDSFLGADILKRDFEFAVDASKGLDAVSVKVIAANLSDGVERDNVDLAKFTGEIAEITPPKKFDEAAAMIDELVAFFDPVEHRLLLDHIVLVIELDSSSLRMLVRLPIHRNPRGIGS